jgi:hypothetical protein
MVKRWASRGACTSPTIPGRGRDFSGFAFLNLGVMTLLSTRFRHDDVFLQEHFVFIA